TATLLLGGCGDTTTAPRSATSTSGAATPSAQSPAGAVAGFLAAAANQDNSQVPVWLATTADTTNLNELLRVYSSFGSSGVFWVVNRLTVIGVDSAGAGRANVTLSGDIVWCLGKAANDPAATCSVVNPVGGRPHTYAAVQVDGRWKVDIDVNSSSGLDHNPQASPTASAPTATPSAT
ncbi:MAG: hypothetical protein M3Z57_08225, partial [Candidatus Dormibacteraeota bacterium]|nr:hypothetical protein [Candidatus Dormibacteraeota bacterium]